MLYHFLEVWDWQTLFSECVWIGMCVICIQNHSNGATWTHLGGSLKMCFFGSRFWAYFWRVLGTVLGSKSAPARIQNRILFRTISYLFLGSMLGSKTPQNEPRWRPKAVSNSWDSEKKRFGNMLFCIVFYNVFGTPGLPRESQDSQETSKIASGNHQEPFKKGSTFWSHFSMNVDPKIAPKVVQRWPNK